MKLPFFLRLTQTGYEQPAIGSPIWVDITRVVQMHRNLDDSMTILSTATGWGVGERDSWQVVETPEQIVEMMRKEDVK